MDDVMADPHDAILEALRLHHVGDISRSEMIGQLVALCEGRYQSGLEDAAKVCEERAREIGEGSIGFTDVCVVIHRIRALADK